MVIDSLLQLYVVCIILFFIIGIILKYNPLKNKVTRPWCISMANVSYAQMINQEREYVECYDSQKFIFIVAVCPFISSFSILSIP